MKVNILGTDAQSKGSIELPAQFKETVRNDLIRRAVLSLQANARQPYGADPESGKRASAKVSKRRRKYRGTYGIGQSRTPRKVMNRNGTRFSFTGAFAPQTVGGRRAHAPKADKIWEQKINQKEKRKAIRCALSATTKLEIIKERGHKVPEKFPFIISDDFQKISKTKELQSALEKLGFKDELQRALNKKTVGGKAALRGRKTKTKKSILFVVSEDCELEKASANILGTDIVKISSVNAELLAPGAQAGRLTLYTQSAIKLLEDKKLFTKNYKGTRIEKLKPTKKEVVKKTPKKVAKVKKEVPKEKPKKETKPATEKKESPKPVEESK